jgi:hypothetical protein
MKNSRFFYVFTLLLGINTYTFAQKVKIRFNPEIGKELHYKVTMNQDIAMQMEDSTKGAKSVMTFYVSGKPSEKLENGDVKIDAFLSRVTLKINDIATHREEEYDSSLPLKSDANEKARNMDETLRPMLSKTFYMFFSQNGKFIKTEGLPEGANTEMLETCFASEMPDKTLQQGDSWQDIEEDNSDEMKITTESILTLEKTDDLESHIRCVGDVKLAANDAKNTCKGFTILDTKTGVVKLNEASMQIEIPMGTMKMIMKVDTKAELLNK